MTAIVTIEGLALILLALLVAGLLRSHAEILGRLSRASDQEGAGENAPPLETEVGVALPRANPTPAFDLTGVDLDGGVLAFGLVGSPSKTLIAFLSSGCLTCAEFWQAFAHAEAVQLPRDTRLVIVTKDADEESPSKLRKLAPAGVPVLMSTSAWRDYDVPLAPYFIYVDGASGVIGEGAGASWAQVVSLLEQATDDVEFLTTLRKREERGGRRRRRRRESDDAREARADAELIAAGFYPDDPRLYNVEPPVEVAEGD
jgi:hypothetical protein